MTVHVVGLEPEGERPRACTVDPEAPSRVAREWLVTNGLGGYAAGTVSGIVTRRFHGLLVAALPSPLGRTMMLNHLSEIVHLEPDPRSPRRLVQLGAQEHPGRPLDVARCTQFRAEVGLPVWRFEWGDLVIERRVLMPHRQNTTWVVYTMLAGSGTPVLELEPWVSFRPHEGTVEGALDAPYELRAMGNRYEVVGTGAPALRMQVHGTQSAFRIEGSRIHEVRYPIEASRGYDASGDLYTPGSFRAPLERGKPIAFVASVEDWRTIGALAHDEVARLERERRSKLLAAVDLRVRDDVCAELVLAADQFVIEPAGRVEDAARASAMGDEVRTVIAGYHWFTDWGRDTMIALEGATLVTGRWSEAGYILRTFAHYVRDGLVPNVFPEGKNAGLYHTADATLWFFHALDRYLETTGDRATLRLLMPVLLDIAAQHMRGTRFGIAVDPDDGLLRQGADGYALTWMDAKVGDLVVTPRRGKAVEINALWYQALRLLEKWSGDDAAARHFGEAAERVRVSFNGRFWNERGGYLYDVIDGELGDDDAFRPNQIFAVSLPYAVLDRARWEPVVRRVHDRLLTPLGLRSLAPESPDYRAKYFGDLRARDLAYHQGTVWAWLIGPFVDAWIRVHPGRARDARSFLAAFEAHLSEASVGSISEIFDAEPPYVPRGCVAQAWSVAEVLRSFATTA